MVREMAHSHTGHSYTLLSDGDHYVGGWFTEFYDRGGECIRVEA